MLTDNDREKKKVVLWDIDGTLISTARNQSESPHVQAIRRHGFKSKTNFPKLIGSTDYEVILELIYGQTVTKQKILEECFYDLDTISLLHYNTKSFSICTGFPEVLEKVNAIGWENGILTGNTKKRMFQKLEIVKLMEHFNHNLMFSCNFSETRENIAERAKQTLSYLGYSLTVSVGDTPRDINVALNYGFESVAVGTGRFSLKDLSAWNPKLLLTNFQSELNIFLEFIRTLDDKYKDI